MRGRCFRRVSRTYRNTYVRWVCSKRNGQGASQCDNKTAVDENELIEKLDEYFQSLIQDKRKIAQMLRQELRRASTDADTAAEEKILLQDRLGKLEKTRQKYLELYADDLITRQELDIKLRSTRAEVEQLQTRLHQLQFSALSESAIDRVIDRVFQSLDDFITVRNLNNGQLKRLISKVEVDKDANVDVYLRLFNES